ncbi:hypothetical protein NE237_000101 [Protea cynaroides]|uniref:Phosducin domain-containing protein n=1 Tax=Protea cynaroides TaxID=273540 RepID=A0A9Q0GL73_9MAGN|nr:hypothetical protein NE237_000101 [Protea cynaroides]
MASKWSIAGEIWTPTRSGPMAEMTAWTTCIQKLQRISSLANQHLFPGEPEAHGINHLVIPTRDYIFAPSFAAITQAVNFIHSVQDVEGASTQWDDIQRKLGNLPPKPTPFKPPSFIPTQDEDSKPKNKVWIDEKTEEELEDLEDDADLDDDRFLEEYRKKRLAEMREAVRVARFGSVIPISGSDFVREVSQAPPDVWVVVFLFKEGIPECNQLMPCLEELASRYPETKFVKIISTDCIPNYPDRNLPTLLVYNNSAVKATYVGLHHFGRSCTPEGVKAHNFSSLIEGLRFLYDCA